MGIVKDESPSAQIVLRRRAEDRLGAKSSELHSPHSETDAQRLVHELEVHQIELEMQNTELRRAQDELELSRNKYIDLYDFAPIGYLTFDEKGLVLELNLTAALLLGIERISLVNKPFSTFIRQELQKRFYLHLQNVLKSPTKQTCELVIKNKDGIPFDIQLESIAMTAAGQKVVRAALTDVTERKQAEEALRESEARDRQREGRYQNILDNMEEAYYEVDLKGNFMFFNTTAINNLGYTKNEMMGMNFRQYVDKDCEHKVIEVFHNVFLTGDAIKGVDWDLISKAGEKRPIESSISLMRDTQGNPIGFRGIIRDITERKQVEKEREKLILELQQAIKEVKTLSGLLPICASCKKIRDDKGYWNQIEWYIGKHSDAQFSHGICPECAKKFYMELNEK